MPPKFRGLSISDQFRVCRFLTRGEAPHDPKLAAIALDSAEWYRAQRPALAEIYRWYPLALALCMIGLTLPGALKGQVGMAIFFSLSVLGVIGNLMLNPWTRPKNVGRCLEASRRVVASRGD
jgi:hypothetical protein